MRPRVGFLGTGWIGRHRMEAMLAAGLVEAAAIADPSHEMREEAAASAPGCAVLETFDELLTQRAAASVYTAKRSESQPDGAYSARWQVNW